MKDFVKRCDEEKLYHPESRDTLKELVDSNILRLKTFSENLTEEDYARYKNNLFLFTEFFLTEDSLANKKLQTLYADYRQKKIDLFLSNSKNLLPCIDQYEKTPIQFTTYVIKQKMNMLSLSLHRYVFDAKPTTKLSMMINEIVAKKTNKPETIRIRLINDDPTSLRLKHKSLPPTVRKGNDGKAYYYKPLQISEISPDQKRYSVTTYHLNSKTSPKHHRNYVYHRDFIDTQYGGRISEDAFIDPKAPSYEDNFTNGGPFGIFNTAMNVEDPQWERVNVKTTFS